MFLGLHKQLFHTSFWVYSPVAHFNRQDSLSTDFSLFSWILYLLGTGSNVSGFAFNSFSTCFYVQCNEIYF